MSIVWSVVWLLLLTLVGGSFSSSHAEAQSRVRIDRPHTGGRPFQLDVHGGFAWWGAGGAVGARFGIPIVENGFVSSINNAVYINFGADAYFIRYRRRGNDVRGTGAGFPVALHWEFYFHENWSAFAEVGANLFLFHPALIDDGEFYAGDAAAWFLWAVGGRFNINESISLTLRLGGPYTSFGVTFML